MNIKDILLIITIIYVFYLHSKINKINNIENFAVIDDIRTVIKEIYNTDMEAVRQLAKMAEDLTKGGYKVIGDLTVTGNIKTNGKLEVSGDISNTWITNTLSSYNSTFQSNYNNFSSSINTKISDLEMKTSRMRDHMYYPDGTTIYDNIITALNNGQISKYGSPSGWDSSSYNSAVWNGKNMIQIGNNSFPNGITIYVPGGYKTLWIRIIRDRWENFTIFNGSGVNLGKYARGRASINSIAPDGATGNGNQWHYWIPCCVPGGESYYIIGGDHGTWISGIAYSTNPWNHGQNSALSYHWGYNGSTNVDWNNENWNGDIIAQCRVNTSCVLYVPNIYSGKDKLVYFVEHNSNWDCGKHEKIYSQDTEIERLRTSYNNPFATHFNSKPFSRFMAARIPAYLTNTNLLKITMQTGPEPFVFRECGTIDYYT